MKLGQGFAQPIKAPSNQSNVVASIPATTTPPAPDAFQTMLMDAIKNAQHSPQASHEHGPQAPHTPHIPTNAAGHTPEANHPPKEHNPSGPFVQPEPAAAVHAVPQHPAKPVPVTQQPSAQIESPAHVEQALPQEVLQTAAMG